MFSPDFLSGNKTFYIFLFFILFCCEAKTQTNLVYNGDFELYDTCPLYESGPFDLQIEHCLGWTVATWGTSDYFNTCNNSIGFHNVGIPSNLIGYQYGFNGNGYTGGFFYYLFYQSLVQYREYIQGTLTNALQIGKKYKFSLQLSLANTSAIAIKNIGVTFTNSKIFIPSSWKPLNNIPTISLTSSLFFKDTLNWIKLDGEFIANGTENYFTIGNFTDTLVSDTIRVIPFDSDLPDYSSYYYIDDVKLYDAEEIKSNLCLSNIANVFSPNNDGVNDVFKITNCGDILNTSIYNRWGNLEFQTENQNHFWDGRTTSGEKCVDGTYFYIIETKEKTIKGFVQLIR
jgi:OOP family OmpA-OmpF porin